MVHEVVPYNYNHQGFHLERWPQTEPISSQEYGWYGVHFTFDPQYMPFLTNKIHAWFEGRDEIIWVNSGDCEKQHLSFIVLEWEHCEIDPLFLAILRDEEMIDSFSVYWRSAEDY